MRILRSVLFGVLSSVIFTLIGLCWHSTVDAGVLGKESKPYYATVSSAGYPYPMIADDPAKENFGSIGMEDRILPMGFLINIGIFSLAMIPIFIGREAMRIIH